MIDIHCHILPGLDDGPRTMDESLSMARMAVEDGIRGMLCTPHWHPMLWPNEREAVFQAVKGLQTRLDDEGIALRLWAGSELNLDVSIAAGLEEGRLGTLNGGPWILLELPGAVPPRGIDEFFWELRQRGYRVILAHPERYDYVRRDPACLFRWATMGVAMQVTASGLLGRFGEEMASLCRLLLEHRLVHFLASDGHGVRSRRPLLRQAVDLAAEAVGEGAANRLVHDHPLSVLRGESLDLGDWEPLAPQPKARPWYSVFRKRP